MVASSSEGVAALATIIVNNIAVANPLYPQYLVVRFPAEPTPALARAALAAGMHIASFLLVSTMTKESRHESCQVPGGSNGGGSACGFRMRDGRLGTLGR
jgi:hypothetical protein